VLSGQSPAALLLVTISRHLAAAWRHAAIYRWPLGDISRSAGELDADVRAPAAYLLVHGSRWLMELAATRQTCPQLMSPIWSPVY
jgi:hypothetical protein